MLFNSARVERDDDVMYRKGTICIPPQLIFWIALYDEPVNGRPLMYKRRRIPNTCRISARALLIVGIAFESDVEYLLRMCNEWAYTRIHVGIGIESPVRRILLPDNGQEGEQSRAPKIGTCSLVHSGVRFDSLHLQTDK